MKTLKITVEGGFHNADEMTVYAKVRTARDGSSYACLSPYQAHKVEAHFCGISDCQCGGASRGTWASPAGWVQDTMERWVQR